ncbi:hypothetical protein ES703_67543 [subsurface metagenome]
MSVMIQLTIVGLAPVAMAVMVAALTAAEFISATAAHQPSGIVIFLTVRPMAAMGVSPGMVALQPVATASVVVAVTVVITAELTAAEFTLPAKILRPFAGSSGLALVIVIALPGMLILVPLYRPLLMIITSPLPAASIASWIEG